MVLGAGHSFIFPTMDKVSRIEVTRSPSSTLWGSYANIGIVHIITKNAEDIKYSDSEIGGFEFSTDYESFSDDRGATLQYGKIFESNASVYASLRIFDGDRDRVSLFAPGARETELLDANYGATYPGIGSRESSIYDYKESYEFYLKGDYEDWSFILNSSELTSHVSFATDVEGTSDGQWSFKKNYLDLRYAPELSETLRFENKFYIDEIWDRFRISSLPTVFEAGYTGVGAESIAYLDVDDFEFLFGVTVDRRELLYELGTGDTFIDDLELNYGGFTQASYLGIYNWRFTVGLRYDYNNLRDEGGNVLPSFAIKHQVNNKWILKYLMNTGFVRPNIDFIPVGEDLESQRGFSHDFQIIYLGENSTVTTTFFVTEIEDIVPTVPEIRADSESASTVSIYGFELEFKYQSNPKYLFYGNYSYNDASFDDTQLQLK